jgi:hypothetical protein
LYVRSQPVLIDDFSEEPRGLSAQERVEATLHGVIAWSDSAG